MRTKIKVNLLSKSKGSGNAVVFYFEDEEGTQYSFEVPRDNSGNHTTVTGRILESTTHSRFIISTELIPKGEKRFQLFNPRIIMELEDK